MPLTRGASAAYITLNLWRLIEGVTWTALITVGQPWGPISPKGQWVLTLCVSYDEVVQGMTGKKQNKVGTTLTVAVQSRHRSGSLNVKLSRVEFCCFLPTWKDDPWCLPLIKSHFAANSVITFCQHVQTWSYVWVLRFQLLWKTEKGGQRQKGESHHCGCGCCRAEKNHLSKITLMTLLCRLGQSNLKTGKRAAITSATISLHLEKH